MKEIALDQVKAAEQYGYCFDLGQKLDKKMLERWIKQGLVVKVHAPWPWLHNGGIIHEDALFDAAEMALDGATSESMVKPLKQARSEAYQPTSGWRRG